MPKVILEMKHITKKFPGVKALDDVNFELYEQEILSLVGENGAGKSTLMKILSGAYSRYEYSGEIILNGSVQSFNNPADSERYGIQMIYQETNAMLDLNIAENIFIGRYPKKKSGSINWKEVYAEAGEVLARVGLTINPRELVRNLSTSQQQLVAIAKAIRVNPFILVLDEPTSTLTKSECENLFVILNELISQGISCIYISHKLDEVFKISDRIIVMRDGKNAGKFNKGEFERKDIITCMVGREISNMYPKEPAAIGNEILRVEHIRVQHPYNPQKNIIEDVNFSLHRGEILGLAGLVGSGRSELVNAIFGVRKPKSSGDVYMDGKKLRIDRPRDALAHGIALATEDRKKNGIVLIKPIRDNISLASLGKISRFGNINRREETKRVQIQFDNLRIKAPGIDTLVVNLSGGNQQKVVLGKWLSTDLKVLILDEPTRGIDVGAKVEIYHIMNRLAKEGVGIIMISSELPELIGMCDRFLVLAQGRVNVELLRCEADEVSIMMAAM
ncbi:MAG: sugar ABC transporter ATP-binding protein [Spirochaetaceae bacterium]|jgi:D-xylose transport system ATP-binding protein|nr:sugar ABC transporter ATP-binding protein [Spirochaetaceae bacterium]